QRTILDTYYEGSPERLGATDILGRSAWSNIKLVRILAGQSNRWILYLCGGALFAEIFLLVAVPANFYNGFFTILFVYFASTIVAYALLQMFIRRAGLASARGFRNALNKMLCIKLLGSGAAERDILMADLNDGTHPCLRIVAADISSRQLRLF